MDFKKLAGQLIKIAETAAPLVGMNDELQAGKALYEAITGAVDTVKGSMSSDDQNALQGSLDALQARVNAHADTTIAKLG